MSFHTTDTAAWLCEKSFVPQICSFPKESKRAANVAFSSSLARHSGAPRSIGIAPGFFSGRLPPPPPPPPPLRSAFALAFLIPCTLQFAVFTTTCPARGSRRSFQFSSRTRTSRMRREHYANSRGRGRLELQSRRMDARGSLRSVK